MSIDRRGEELVVTCLYNELLYNSENELIITIPTRIIIIIIISTRINFKIIQC